MTIRTTPELWRPDKATWRRMFKAVPGKRRFAAELLSRMTPAEMCLWAELSKINSGTKNRPTCPWRPQVVIKGWIVDFYHDGLLRAIELDGPVHDDAQQQAKDGIKDTVLSHFGIRVMRFKNAEVFRDPEALMRKIMGYT